MPVKTILRFKKNASCLSKSGIASMLKRNNAGILHNTANVENKKKAKRFNKRFSYTYKKPLKTPMIMSDTQNVSGIDFRENANQIEDNSIREE